MSFILTLLISFLTTSTEDDGLSTLPDDTLANGVLIIDPRG